jgi:hypothetical protein
MFLLNVVGRDLADVAPRSDVVRINGQLDGHSFLLFLFCRLRPHIVILPVSTEQREQHQEFREPKTIIAERMIYAS